MTVSCANCGGIWALDPALEVPCSGCHVDVGERCRRPSGPLRASGVASPIPNATAWPCKLCQDTVSVLQK